MSIWDGSKYKTYDPEREGYGNRNQWRKTFQNRMGMDEATKIMSGQAETPYQILGVTPQNSKVEIRAAYMKLVKQWHPDRNPENIEVATEMMKKINAAYTILTEGK